MNIVRSTRDLQRNSLKQFGKAREKCIAMLEELGITVRSCSPAVGHWRSSPFADVYRWKFSGEYKGVTICGGCWETMTECAKAGRLELNEKESEVWPTSRSPKTKAAMRRKRKRQRDEKKQSGQ